MALIEIDVTKKPGIIELGVQGDKEADGIEFDITPWVKDYGLGTAYIYNQPRTYRAPYFKELQITSSDDVYKATWIFDDADTAKDGEGACQLVYVKDNVVKRTPAYVTVTAKSLGEATGKIPDPYGDLLVEANRIYQECRNQAAISTAEASEAAQHEANAVTAKVNAQDAAEDAAESAVHAGNVFQIIGDASFPVDPVTRKVKLHLDIMESE